MGSRANLASMLQPKFTREPRQERQKRLEFGGARARTWHGLQCTVTSASGCHCRVTMLNIVGEACKHRVDSTRCLQQFAIKFEGLQCSPPSPNARLQCSPPSPYVKSVELQRSPPSPNLKQCRVKVSGCQKVESYNAYNRRRIAKSVQLTDWQRPPSPICCVVK